MADTEREKVLSAWLHAQFKTDEIKLVPLSGDAGFRNYFRFEYQQKSYIAVDALPSSSNNVGFVAIAQRLQRFGVVVPDIIYYDLDDGLFCLADFGHVLLSEQLTQANVMQYYKKAIDILLTIASIPVDCKAQTFNPSLNYSALKDASPEDDVLDYDLPDYDHSFVTQELAIFTDWLLGEHLQLPLTSKESKQLKGCFSFICEKILTQPKVFMHRDYHSRNIMCLADHTLGIIDFQDSVKGPITYDVVSLLRDCYLRWPDKLVNELFAYFVDKIQKKEHVASVSDTQWQQWFDLTGLQRHLKASGIFARLYHRDHKENYLKDIPLTLGYVIDISEKYEELLSLHLLVKNKVMPALNEKMLANIELSR